MNARVCLFLLICCGLLSPAVAFYGVAVPIARSSGLDAVPNVDCLFVYSCAPRTTSSILPPLNSDPFDQLPNNLVPSAQNNQAALRSVYVGRAAGRCQRRLAEFKCQMVDAVNKENECRATEWPDEDVAPVVAVSPIFVPETCIVQQCQGQQLVLHYAISAANASLRLQQQYWIAQLHTEFHSADSVTGCNLPLSAFAPEVDFEGTEVRWLRVNSTVLVGPFGVPSDGERPPIQPCSAASCAPLSLAQLPSGLAPGSCNISIPTGFTCSLEPVSGFTMVGSSLLTCVNGSFAPQPWPLIRESSCTLPSVLGLVSSTCSVFPSGSNCTVELAVGFAIASGSNSLQCEQGKFSSIPIIMSMDDISLDANVSNSHINSSISRRLLLKETKTIEELAKDLKAELLPIVDLVNPANSGEQAVFDHARRAIQNTWMTTLPLSSDGAASSSSAKKARAPDSFILPIRLTSTMTIYLQLRFHDLYSLDIWIQTSHGLVRLEQLKHGLRHLAVKNPPTGVSAYTIMENILTTWDPINGKKQEGQSTQASSGLIIWLIEALRFHSIATGLIAGELVADVYSHAIVTDYDDKSHGMKPGQDDVALRSKSSMNADRSNLAAAATAEYPWMSIDSAYPSSEPYPFYIPPGSSSVGPSSSSYSPPVLPPGVGGAYGLTPFPGAAEVIRSQQAAASSLSDSTSSSSVVCEEAQDLSADEVADNSEADQPDHEDFCNANGGCLACRPNSLSRRRLLDTTEVLFFTDSHHTVEEIFLPFSVADGGTAWVRDFNSDGFDDILVVSRSNSSCGGLLHRSIGTLPGLNRIFAPPICIPHQLGYGAATILGDFDSDGNTDYLVRNSSLCPSMRQYAVLFGARNGTVSSSVCVSSLRADFTQWRFISLDLNLDRRSDILSQSLSRTRDPCVSHVTLLRNQDDEQHVFHLVASCLISETPLPAAHSQILLGDLNGDRFEDIFFVCDSTSGCGGCAAGAGGAFLSLGNGSFSDVTCFPHILNSYPRELPTASGVLALQDMNGDGLADVITSFVGSCPSIAVFLTQVQFSSTNSSDDDAPYGALLIGWAPLNCSGPKPITDDGLILVGDINLDGSADLLLSHDHECHHGDYDGSSFFLGTGNGTFAQRQCLWTSFASDGPGAFSSLIDWNGDGIKEVITQRRFDQRGQILMIGDVTQQ